MIHLSMLTSREREHNDPLCKLLLDKSSIKMQKKEIMIFKSRKKIWKLIL